MKRLNELQTLIRLAEAVGQTPDPKILDELSYLKEKQSKQQLLQTKLKQRVKAASKELFNTEVSVPVLENEETWTQRVIDEAPAPLVEEVLITPEPEPQSAAAQVADYITRNPVKETVVSQGEPGLVSKSTDPIVKKVELLERWISRIAATGPGGGAAQIYNLDIPVKTVTGDYTIGRKDYYIGVSSTVKTYITLPALGSNQKEGRMVVIKDESGHAQLTPIAIVGTIDNDPNGAEIRINNGAIQLVYRSGWRII